MRGPGHLNFPEHAIVVPCQYCMTDLFNDVVSLFRQFQSWETSVLDAIARERPLTDILNLSHMVTRDTGVSRRYHTETYRTHITNPDG